ncbi:hypothetical protein DWQ65_09600 [Treponema phagedenis]|uniref:Uncharacterized protein n=1 Tax=Treponema phagedenis TaxID=162 RepID=A0A0B7GZ72_TREPH|nr:hypothetical protein [Treponema phagedenis]EFW38735.1 hypothetical protein HMPREF9554_00771 [Treponema phagedenis F0421]QEJ96228.1 hypothetical protein FUT79_14160 [Treponema phagedenis]QEK00006.1 hypothetical protein FUT84_01630 [Treponema phagedenis]QEK07463.1 hypothetical protein FUT80_12535 [Treponema phagedenis]QKS93382.1 hypothetical protein HPJ96_13115 [Treponema phagedenis]
MDGLVAEAKDKDISSVKIAAKLVFVNAEMLKNIKKDDKKYPVIKDERPSEKIEKGTTKAQLKKRFTVTTAEVKIKEN